MAKYKKRKDGRYQSNITIGTDEETGKRIIKTIYARTIPELENIKFEIKDQINKGIYADDKRITVKEWSEKWLIAEKSICGIRTKEMYEYIVNSYIIPSIGNIRLRNIKKSDLQIMINGNSGHYRTCEQIRMTIKQILEAAIDEGLIYKNVAQNLSLPPKIVQEKRALSDDEKAGIKNADFTDYEKVFVYILLYCGIRRGEILALSRQDINLKSHELNIKNTITFDGNTPVFKPIPKTINGIRSIPIPDELFVILKNYLDHLNGFYLFEMEKANGIMSKSSYNKLWKRIIAKINIGAGGKNAEKATNEHAAIPELKVIHGLTAHVFRHNYATMLYYNGIDVKDAQRLLGHASIKITLDIYTHLDNNKSNAKEKLSNISAL